MLKLAVIWKNLKRQSSSLKKQATICSTQTTALTTHGTGHTPLCICLKTATSKTLLTSRNLSISLWFAQAEWTQKWAHKQLQKDVLTQWALHVNSSPTPNGSQRSSKTELKTSNPAFVAIAVASTSHHQRATQTPKTSPTLWDLPVAH